MIDRGIVGGKFSYDVRGRGQTLHFNLNTWVVSFYIKQLNWANSVLNEHWLSGENEMFIYNSSTQS